MKSTSAMPERILAYGAYSSGKTHSWATIAEHYRVTETPGHFYVINTEPGAIDRLADAYEGFGTNVDWWDVRDWNGLERATTEILGVVTADDWVVVEGIDMPWIWVRKDYDEYAAEKAGIDWRKERWGTVPENDDRGKWDPINGVYQGWIMPLIDPLMNPGHLYATAPPKPVIRPTGKPNEWRTDDDNIAAFGWLGLYPQGQKFLGRHFHSVLFMRKLGAREWQFTSADDHARETVVDQPLNNFVLDYLIKLARWKP